MTKVVKPPKPMFLVDNKKDKRFYDVASFTDRNFDDPKIMFKECYAYLFKECVHENAEGYLKKVYEYADERFIGKDMKEAQKIMFQYLVMDLTNIARECYAEYLLTNEFKIDASSSEKYVIEVHYKCLLKHEKE